MSLHWLDLLLPATWYCCTRTDEVRDTKTIRIVLVVCFCVYRSSQQATSSSSMDCLLCETGRVLLGVDYCTPEWFGLTPYCTGCSRFHRLLNYSGSWQEHENRSIIANLPIYVVYTTTTEIAGFLIYCQVVGVASWCIVLGARPKSDGKSDPSNPT
jgi:hypothetical protein